LDVLPGDVNLCEAEDDGGVFIDNLS